MSVAGIHLDGRRVPLRDPLSEPPTLGLSERIAAMTRSWAPRQVAGSRMVRLDAVDVRSAAPYLAVWASVLFVVQLVVYTFGYFLLYALGVVRSLSHSLALVLGSSVPKSGVLPAFAPSTVLVIITVLSIVLSGLAFLAGCSLVLTHNVACQVTGGVHVQVRATTAPATSTPPTAAPLGWPDATQQRERDPLRLGVARPGGGW